MKPLERNNLIYNIALDLQKRMTFTEIEPYLSAYKVKLPNEGYSSKKIYVQIALKEVKDDIIEAIAYDLGLITSYAKEIIDINFWKKGYYKIFISHLTEDKATSRHLNFCLFEYSISGFVTL